MSNASEGPRLSGPPGRLQLVEHRVDPVERRLQIDDPALLDILEARFDGGPKLFAASLGFADRSGGLPSSGPPEGE